jgi:peroxiredoxin
VLLAFADRYRTLAPLDSITSAAERLQARVVVVCHEKQQTLMSLGARDKIRMLMLADATGEVSAVYGLYDWRQGETEPGFFVLDPEGVVRLAVLGRLFPPQTMFEFLRYSTGDWESSSRSP